LLGGLISEYERACGCPKLGAWPLTLLLHRWRQPGMIPPWHCG
jgi:hypothetical protein